MKLKFLILILIISTQTRAQHYVLDSITPKYGHLINFEANTFQNAIESPYFQNFFTKLDSVYQGKKKKVHIFHIGGSHIQADIYSNKIRTYLQNYNDVALAQRGFVFPYHLAHTNNPLNYRIEADKSKWQGYRCSVKKDSVAWGLSGVSAAFRGVEEKIYVKSNYRNYTKKPYTFNKLRVFYNTWMEDYDLKISDSTLVESDTINYTGMYKEYRFTKTLDSVALHLKVKDTTCVSPEFLMMGMEFMNDDSGVEYTSIGVNGASFAWYKRSVYFENQLQLYKPDMFIISVGTNDAYVPEADFDAEEFRAYYEDFIKMIQRANPDCAILLTVPNDDYYQKRIPNPNTVVQQQIILELTQKYNMAVWDLFSIMGGLGSSNNWYKAKLMPRDRIHFTQLGYSIKADLFLKAMVDAWAKSTNQDRRELLMHFKNLDE
ncbi:GDSL-like lipase/acylhydrolase family protein [Formosa agariphila KMM 3901]|uniref:GDSL-like lipase/acylhydrolase family protein n=1 Tax=Formosa agariphila (strain DSM 15362 / KCTC 12365 / LMG 23005 / KMM 3901 / M-2Alg 35-1) TaxID=1347342 RepID=T2KMK4_FORAG|nr:GDSL-type esterase/lipase family protein [Formosa agariphila]CDF80127.1 GDSL-like lipase/acylhydrolase family protein [Formosa agariphila KMM 3901]